MAFAEISCRSACTDDRGVDHLAQRAKCSRLPAFKAGRSRPAGRRSGNSAFLGRRWLSFIIRSRQAQEEKLGDLAREVRWYRIPDLNVLLGAIAEKEVVVRECL